MRVLFSNRSKEAWVGGDYIQMEKTAEALRAKGIDVVITDQDIFLPVGMYQNFDIIHCWNFSMAWTRPQMGLAILHKKPIVCSMIYHQTDKFVTYPEQRFMASYLDKGIFLNEGEVKRFSKKVKLPQEKIEIIGNGIDADWFKSPSRGSYALTVGRIGSFKGQLEVAKACKYLKIPFHIVGEPEDEEYFNKCLKEGAIYKGIMNKEELKEEYAGASVVVVASKNELMSLVAMEAIAMGKRLVMTSGSEWKPEGIQYCKWGNVTSIKHAIEKSLSEPVNLKLKNELRKQTWENVADRLIKIYEETLRNHNIYRLPSKV